MQEKFDVKIILNDGCFLAATIYIPKQLPAPVLLEALPYRKDDLTAGYRPEYDRFRDEFGYAVCRVDLRGTGSSSGIAIDEYAEQEQLDLTEVINWLSNQEWCSGNVGMFGTSYSGFNSLHMGMESVPALKAICAIYATDDRWTDDVHYCGGSLRLLDQIDYPLYMVACNALPPVPAVFGEGWYDEWVKRLKKTPAWMIKWLRESNRNAYWQHGSVRPNYNKLKTPTMLITGWADGYRNNSFRTAKALADSNVPVYLIAGPWSHQSPSYSVPGPNVDHIPLMAEWFDRFLKNDVKTNSNQKVDLFIRQWNEPSVTAQNWNGFWVSDTITNLLNRTTYQTLSLNKKEYIISVNHPPTVGISSWNSCAGGLPWGQPSDQRSDNANSVCIDLPFTQTKQIVGNPKLKLRLCSSSSRATVAAHLCVVKHDGTSLLISRGFLSLSYKDGLVSGENLQPSQVIPEKWYDIELELDSCAYEINPSETLRVAISITEFPNVIAPPEPQTLLLNTAKSFIQLPIVNGSWEELEIKSFINNSSFDKESSDVNWYLKKDIVKDKTSVYIDHTSKYESLYDSNCFESYQGSVEIDEKTWEQSASGKVDYEVDWGEHKARTVASLELGADRNNVVVNLRLNVFYNGGEIFSKTWEEVLARKFG